MKIHAAQLMLKYFFLLLNAILANDLTPSPRPRHRSAFFRMEPPMKACTIVFHLVASSTALGQVIEFAPPPFPPVYSLAFGFEVAGLGDVDEDGLGDVAVADSSGQTIGDDRFGRVYVYSGRTGELVRTLYPPPRTGMTSGFGERVSCAGDLDGDGVDDLAITADTNTDPGGPSFAGRVHVHSGATGSLLYSLRPDPDAPNLNFGSDLARVPDLDGDGVSDLVVGSYREARAYVFSGATGEQLYFVTSPGTCSCAFGVHVAGIPDLDGDGRGDFAVGSREPIEPGSPIWGKVFIFSGAKGEFKYELAIPGTSLEGATDLDGDGRGDLLIANTNLNPEYELDYSGYVQVVSGANGQIVRILTCPEPKPGTEFGASVALAPDMGGDGVAEILVGMRGPGLNGAGGAYLFSGGSGEHLRALVSPQPQPSGNFGISVSSVPDVNGDGRAELLVGAHQEWFDNGNSRGRAYMFLSCPADLNADGVATSADFFHFLSMFFSEQTGADFNRDSRVNSQDFFDYLAAFFAGCP